jgi:AraC-like DNA-binding protein
MRDRRLEARGRGGEALIDGTPYSGPHWQRYATTDTEQAHDYLRRAYLDVNVRFAEDTIGGVGLRTAATSLGDIGVSPLRYSARTMLRTAPDGDLNITHLLHGRLTVARGKDEYGLRSGELGLILPDDAIDADFGDVDAFIVRLPRTLIEDVAHARTGVDRADLRFDSARPISPHLSRHWTRTLSYLAHGVLSDPALMASPLIVDQARQLLAVTALAVFPNTGLDAQPHPRGDVTPRTLRRAIAYADENTHRAVTVQEMAAAAGVRPRALQVAFRRYRDTTPSQYARQVRLERAHRDLQAADPTTGVTVTMIATRWGFAHLGRFSTDYRAVYGTTPSHTLRT